MRKKINEWILYEAALLQNEKDGKLRGRLAIMTFFLGGIFLIALLFRAWGWTCLLAWVITFVSLMTDFPKKRSRWAFYVSLLAALILSIAWLV